MDVGVGSSSPPPIWQEAIKAGNTVDDFHRAYWDSKRWAVQWMGHNILKSPMGKAVLAGIAAMVVKRVMR